MIPSPYFSKLYQEDIFHLHASSRTCTIDFHISSHLDHWSQGLDFRETHLETAKNRVALKRKVSELDVRTRSTLDKVIGDRWNLLGDSTRGTEINGNSWVVLVPFLLNRCVVDVFFVQLPRMFFEPAFRAIHRLIIQY